MTYSTKIEAQQAAQSVPCGEAIWVGPAFLKAYGVKVAGWYVVALGRVA